jgi:hypothetical protein
MVALGALPACRVRVLDHDQRVAAGVAEEFLRHAAVDRDVDAAYRMLSEDGRRRIGERELSEVLEKMHVDAHPDRVQATEYEIVPGEAAIRIFLQGENGSKALYYLVPMVGTVKDGYYPDGIFRNPGPYPKSALRQRL